MAERERVPERARERILRDHARTVARRVASGAACEVTVAGRRLSVLAPRRKSCPDWARLRVAVPHAESLRPRLDHALTLAARGERPDGPAL
ncbi:hypothetical protein [Nocardia farcinica]|uniref:hypothetical protein n=1 Tax=Nocardia farcinica TaxID=37329 RepID=UPI002456F970|nr:hypothetical protein [Nocardia farcinica]